jgi:hypothetical protein
MRPPPLGQRMAGVGEQVHEELDEVDSHGPYLGELSVDPGYGGVGLPQNVLTIAGRLLEQVVDLHLFRLARRRPGIGRQIPCELQYPVGRFLDALELVEIGGIHSTDLGQLQERIRVERDGRQGIVDLVGDSRRQLPERRQLLGLHHSPLELLLQRQVLANRQHALDDSPGADDRRGIERHTALGAVSVEQRRLEVADSHPRQAPLEDPSQGFLFPFRNDEVDGLPHHFGSLRQVHLSGLFSRSSRDRAPAWRSSPG